ncbi:MAG: hypothetical protein KBA61_12495, partial [Spirochaetes bacterium]|nr:hypothetical protein [Spirochaetota bacterium]
QEPCRLSPEKPVETPEKPWALTGRAGRMPQLLKSLYLGDNEPYYNVYKDGDSEMTDFVGTLNERLVDFVRDADALVSDSQYLPSEYESKRGWGHSTTHHTVNMAVRAGVKKLFFFHHEPLRSDDDLDSIVEHYRALVAERGYRLEVQAAMERTTHDV